MLNVLYIQYICVIFFSFLIASLVHVLIFVLDCLSLFFLNSTSVRKLYNDTLDAVRINDYFAIVSMVVFIRRYGG